MIGSIGFAGKGAGSAAVTRVVALYERESGTIRHVHIVTTLAGASAPEEGEVVDEARRHAARRRGDTRDLAAAVSTNAAHADGRHRIDPKTGTFVALPPDDSDRTPRQAS